MSLVIEARVIQNKQVIPGYYRITLAAPFIAKKARPGQFLHVRCGSTQDPLLRRPISIHAADRQSGEISLLYRVAGRGTALLAGHRVSDIVSIIGPLGHGFTMPQSDGNVIVVSGGIGIAPLYYFLQELTSSGINATVFQGAPTAKLVLMENEIKELGHSVILATDDGTKGFHGNVTSLFEDYLQNGGFGPRPGTDRALNWNKGQAGQIKDLHDYYKKIEEATQNTNPNSRIFACGPHGMLRRLCEITVQRGIICEVSLEERMGCGVGACLSCACKIKSVDGGFDYRRVCVEGPVFPAGEVSWE